MDEGTDNAFEFLRGVLGREGCDSDLAKLRVWMVSFLFSSFGVIWTNRITLEFPLNARFSSRVRLEFLPTSPVFLLLKSRKRLPSSRRDLLISIDSACLNGFSVPPNFPRFSDPARSIRYNSAAIKNMKMLTSTV